MPVRETFLQTFPAFRRAPEALTEAVLSAARLVDLPGGFRLYHTGDTCQAIGLVLSGEVRVFKTSESGREITLYEVLPGETCILNAACILSGQTYTAEAMVTQAGQALLLPDRVFRRMMDQYPEMRDFVFRLFTDRFAAIIELVETVTFGRMDFRLREYLVEKAENDRLTATHQQIANELGTSREVVSRLLKDLERKGRVSLARNAIQLVNLEVA